MAAYIAGEPPFLNLAESGYGLSFGPCHGQITTKAQ